MPWFKVDDNLCTHPKARAAGLPAMGLWVVSGAYSSSYLTEGHIPEWYVKSWSQGARHADRLVTAGLWTPDGNGWAFHQWDERQPTKEDVELSRKANRERQREWREAQREKKGGSRRE